ncbi:MAG: glycolate oxidase subunit GlcF [Gammaproteobacteria bacterium]|nr:glycolate oxidase subunit GlcF [Gammaproteobacteria bacterium]
MQTTISEKYKNNPFVDDAESILRACVHCGFCIATCPTYQLLGDELDSPRGRIYLIKQVLEGGAVSQKTQTHLDRCLTCRACETTCPSGVRYGRLVEIGREIVSHQVSRTVIEKMQHFLIRKILPFPKRFAPLFKLGQFLRPILPRPIKLKIPQASKTAKVQGVTIAPRSQDRKMLVLQGCVQSAATPQTNIATGRVLQKFGIELLSAANAGCCGAVSHHLSYLEEGLGFMRKNIDAWWPYVEQGIEAIVITASGCGTVIKDYGELLENDPQYAEKAKRISALSKDLSEVLSALLTSPSNASSSNETDILSQKKIKQAALKVAFHSPCTLQHGQQLDGVVESILQTVGFILTPVADPHLCCGSAGTYSILQPQLSQRLLNNKLSALLQNEQPDVIATANIGCQMHMATKATVPVKHWVELLDEML